MTVCVVRHAPVPKEIDLARLCLPSARGRYLYVVLAIDSTKEALRIFLDKGVLE